MASLSFGDSNTKTPLTTSREGLQPATITFDSKPVTITDGLSREMPETLPAATDRK